MRAEGLDELHLLQYSHGASGSDHPLRELLRPPEVSHLSRVESRAKGLEVVWLTFTQLLFHLQNWAGSFRDHGLPTWNSKIPSMLSPD